MYAEYILESIVYAGLQFTVTAWENLSSFHVHYFV